MTEEEVQNRLGELERRLAEVEKLLPALIRLAQSQQQQRLEVISGVLLQSSDTPEEIRRVYELAEASAPEIRRKIIALIDSVAADDAEGMKAMAERILREFSPVSPRE